MGAINSQNGSPAISTTGLTKRFGDNEVLRDVDLTIDNGYLTLVYEAGIVVALFVVLKLFWVMFTAFRLYVQSTNREAAALYAALLFTLIVFLTNNVVNRYLFGIGNPFSLLSLFLIVMLRADFITSDNGSTAMQNEARQKRHRPSSDLSKRSVID